jgi:hypothetical protein
MSPEGLREERGGDIAVEERGKRGKRNKQRKR